MTGFGRVIEVTEREHIGIDGARAIETPLVIGDALCGLGFDIADGGESLQV